MNNKEFLEKYASDEEQIKYYTEKAMELYRYFEIDDVDNMTYDGVSTNVRTWFKNKKSLFKLFRNHPMWNEEAKAIIFHQDYNRELDTNVFKTYMNNLLEYCFNKIKQENKQLVVKDNTPIIHFSKFVKPEQYLSDDNAELIEYMKNAYNVDIAEGQKVSKIINKLMKQIVVVDSKYELEEDLTPYYQVVNATTLTDKTNDDDRDFESYNKIFAKLSDSINPLKIDRISVISLNFLDYATMSHGNSWSSCHYINSHNLYHQCDQTYEGQWKGGTLSYANDSTSIIFYILNKDYTGNDYCYQPKIQRQMFHYNIDDEILLQCRLYPATGVNSFERKQYRQLMQEIISKCSKSTNSWFTSRDKYKFDICTAPNSHHYCDYDNFEVTWSYKKDNSYIGCECIPIGHVGYSLCDGEELHEDGGLMNEDEIVAYCDICGSPIYDGDDILRGEYDEVYCENCSDIGNIAYCEDCGLYYRVEDMHTVYDSSGCETEICTRCLDDGLYYQCDVCGDWCDSDILNYDEETDKEYCEYCYKELLKNRNEAA